MRRAAERRARKKPPTLSGPSLAPPGHFLRRGEAITGAGAIEEPEAAEDEGPVHRDREGQNLAIPLSHAGEDAREKADTGDDPEGCCHIPCPPGKRAPRQEKEEGQEEGLVEDAFRPFRRGGRVWFRMETLLKYQDDIARIQGSKAAQLLQEVKAEAANPSP